MLQLMPEADEALAAELEEKMKTIPPVTKMITDGMTAEDILFAVTDGFDMLMDNHIITPEYRCKCSKERMERALISIGKEELESIRKNPSCDPYELCQHHIVTVLAGYLWIAVHADSGTGQQYHEHHR